MKKFTHKKLARDLALTKQTIFVNVPLGSVWFGAFKYLGKRHRDSNVNIGGTPIGDVVCVRCSYTQFCIDVYEVKVSRSDFLKEIRTEKWKSYLPHCHRFYFATSSNVMIFKNEIPHDVGWIVRGERGWRTVKQSTRRDIEVPRETLLSMLFYKQKQFMGWRDPYEVLPNYIGKYRALNKMGKKISKAVSYYEKHSGKRLDL